MPRGKRLLALGIGTAVTAMLLTGCASPTPAATSSASSPVATPTPAFTSDADAVAAAKAFYLKYLTVANRVLQHPTSGARALRGFLSEKQYKSEASYVQALDSNNTHLSGAITLKRLAFESLMSNARGGTFYVCLDLSSANVVKDGSSSTEIRQGNVQTLEVTMSLSPLEQIESSVRWSGSPVC